MFKSIGFLAIFVTLFVLLEYYTFQSVKVLSKNKNAAYIVLGINIFLYIFIFYLLFTVDRKSGDKLKINLLTVLFFLSTIPKIILALPLILEDISRFFIYLFNLKSENSFYPERRKAISILALGLAAIPFFSIIYGVFKGKFNYKVKKISLKLDKLPAKFKGFKIVQISDIHSGSFSEDHKDELMKGIHLINEQNPDLVLFTGDLVNMVADEIIPFKEVFSQIKAKQGKFSILGNHDYGDYQYGHDEAAEPKNIKNRLKIDAHLADMGFTQLRNQHVKIEKEDAFINLIGVENFGAELRFPKTGDLRVATAGMETNTTNILMSHDPSHFDHNMPEYDNVRDFPIPMHLTLSGHTHGMQFGVEIPGFKWSPIQYMYKNWAGLYEDKGKYLYVNRGFGFLGFPGRVGIWPEITVIELI